MTIAAQTIAYPRSSFTTSLGAVNARSLLVELKAASLPALSVAVTDADALVNYSSVLSPAQETTVNTVVAAHTGEAFASGIQRAVSEPETSDDTGAEVVKLTLDTGPMQAGDYSLAWYAELAVTTTSAATGARGMLYVTKNGGSRVERGQANWGNAQWMPIAGSMPQEVADGDRYVFELAYRRIGTAGNAARVQRARLGWVRLS